MFNRNQIIEWFSDRYTEQQVIEALRIMAENGSDVNPNGDEFSEDITEELEKIFDAVGAAIDNQKKLSASSSEIVPSQVGAIAHQALLEQDISIPVDVLMLIAQSALRQSKAQAQAIGRLYEESFLNELQGVQQSFSKKLLGAFSQPTEFGKTVDKLINAVKPKSQAIDVEAYLQASRQEMQEEKQCKEIKQQEHQNLLAAKKSVIDVDAFLVEYSEWSA